MAKQKDEPKVLLDADVVIHFIKGGCQFKLKDIFPDRLVMLDKVRDELTRRRSEALGVQNFLQWSKIPVEAMPKDITILKEYAKLTKERGPGESACMAVARFRKEYIASSNVRDIKSYCEENGITYYTTLDILEVAIEKGIMTKEECNNFIKEVISKDSYLSAGSMDEHQKNKEKKDEKKNDSMI